MRSIARRTAVGAALLLVMPVAVWISGWRWQPGEQSCLRSHWQKETGFAFPSGHTMFAASWALLAVGLLWPRRRTLTIAILLVWATGVMGSRLLLGMHWPRDLVVATLISWALVAVATWLAQRICGPLTPPAEENREIAQREQES
ncbi:phosphatase PAP2 family protein [Escherichia coli]|nr:phosphatase PAP2 family protein [Escherichia coli]